MSSIKPISVGSHPNTFRVSADDVGLSIPTKSVIAFTIGEGLRLPVRSLTPEEAKAHFEWFTLFVGLNLFQSAFTEWCPMMAFLRKAGVR